MTTVAPAATVPFLLDSITRVDQAQDRVDVVFGLPGAAGWTRCADLLAEPVRFGRWRARLADWFTDRYAEAPDRSTAGYVMSWYLFVPGFLAALMFHHERRVPSLRPEHLAFRMASPRPHPDGIALAESSFVCLPDDPAAGMPGTTVVPDEQALAAILRGRFAVHAAKFVDAYAPTVRLGRRTLWAAATDAVDNCLWLAGRYGGDEGGGVADAALVLPTRLTPFTSGSTLHRADGQWTRRRESCCFHYLIKNGQGECATCPRLSKPQS